MSALEAWLRRWRPTNSSEVSGPQQIAEWLLLALALKAACGVRCGERHSNAAGWAPTAVFAGFQVR